MLSKSIKNKKRLYLDYASGSPVLKSVLYMAKKLESSLFANPSSIHKDGVFAKKAKEEARASIATFFDAHADEIIFTGSGTEANAIALIGTFLKAKHRSFFANKKPHIVTTKIEHPSILRTCEMLELEGAEITYLSVTSDGFVSPRDIKDALRSETILVSVAYANNEIGVIQPIKEIAKVIRNFQKNNTENNCSDTYPLFHVDACQAVQYLDIGVERLGVDLLSWNGTKIGGPRGMGCLYVKRGTPIVSIYGGGGQEYNLRGGTENVTGVVGLSIALREVRKNFEKESNRISQLRDFCVSEITKKFFDARINGSLMFRLPNNINVSFKNFSSELLVLELDAKNISVSAGSACSSDKDVGSHVVSELYGTDDEKKWGTIRVSLGSETKKSDIILLLKTLSCIFEKYKKEGIL